MLWLGILTLFLVQAPKAAPPPDLPEARGIYYRHDSSNWIPLQPAVIADANAKGLELFVNTGGYTDMGMNIACRGSRASLRVLQPNPTFYVRGIGSIKDAMLIRLKRKKNSRVFETSYSRVTVENKGGFDKRDIYKLTESEYADGSFSIQPEEALPRGEYLLVFGNASTAYDFGIDKAK
jgi:hypothetical protein